MSSVGAAASGAAVLDTSARAEASRRNGARSRGPRTADGKARSSRNAVQHGMRAQRFVVLHGEDAAEYQAHEEALVAELAPDGALQAILARRVAAAVWRLMRADRMEAALFAHLGNGDGDLGLALIRDGHGARAFQTLLRYRGTAQAELWRALRTLKALQAEAAPAVEQSASHATGAVPRPPHACPETTMAEMPKEPEARADPGPCGPSPDAAVPAVQGCGPQSDPDAWRPGADMVTATAAPALLSARSTAVAQPRNSAFAKPLPGR